MKAEYNKWYKCQKGQMPEDFENVIIDNSPRDMPTDTLNVLVRRNCGPVRRDTRIIIDSDEGWIWMCGNNWSEWMLPEPYKK